MSDTIIKVENLSKAYRIGVEDQKSETLLGSLMMVLRSPLKNFNDLRNLRNLDKESKSIFWALNDVSFEVKQGDVLGVIGHNGAGKSTLLKILSRITEPTSGKITINGRVSSLLEVGTGFHPDLSGRENIYLNGTILGMTKREIDSKLDEIIAFSGVEKYIDTPVKRYSSGMTVRLAFSVAAHLEPEILIIDEVLAVGDAEFQKKCIGKMKDISGKGRTVLFVSHNLGAIKSLCSSAILLKSGRVEFQGGVSETLNAYITKKNLLNTGKGVVSETMRTIKSEIVKIDQVLLIEDLFQPIEDVTYQDDFKVHIKMTLLNRIENALIDIRITSDEGLIIEHVLNSLLGGSHVTLESGEREFLVTIKNRLAPGNYSLNVGIHNSKGATLEYAEDVYPFTVMKVSKDARLSYPYEFVDGYSHQQGIWQTVK